MGTARFEVAVRAAGIQRALGIAESLYPDACARVIPIEPEAFFVEDDAATAGPVELTMPERVAG